MFRMALGRYDFTRGRTAPELSCSSRCREVNFHNADEWTTLVLVD